MDQTDYTCFSLAEKALAIVLIAIHPEITNSEKPRIIFNRKKITREGGGGERSGVVRGGNGAK